MSRQTHYEKQFYEDTGYSETACGKVVARYNTTKNTDKVSCKNCRKKHEYLIAFYKK